MQKKNPDKQKRKVNVVVISEPIKDMINARKAQTGQSIQFMVEEAVKMYLGVK